MKKNIAVLCGGYSGESVISEQSGQVVYKNLKGGKYNPILVKVSNEGWFAFVDENKFKIDFNDFSFIDEKGKTNSFDGVFIAIHGTPGENGIVQGFLRLLNIPFNSGSVINSSLTFHKKFCNDLLKQYGIPSAQSIYLKIEESYDPVAIINQLGLPCFVKPNKGGSSIGVSKVKKTSELIPAIERAFKEDDEILVEQYINGKEVTCGVVNYKGEIKALSVTEIVFESEFFDYQAKYHDKTTQEITPARISHELTQKIMTLTKKVYKTIECRGMIRVDFIIMNDEPYLIEVNTVPGLSEASIVPKMAAYAGLSLRELFENEVDMMLNAK
jgi:D-alanine-D-alanine ligase